jgi:hypothetical protein
MYGGKLRNAKRGRNTKVGRDRKMTEARENKIVMEDIV